MGPNSGAIELVALFKKKKKKKKKQEICHFLCHMKTKREGDHPKDRELSPEIKSAETLILYF